MAKLLKRVQPFSWNAVLISFDFTQGQPLTVNLSSYLRNPRGQSITYTLSSGSLPSGVTHTAGVVSYDGIGGSATADCEFTATSSTGSATARATVQIIGSNQAPYWSGAPLQLNQTAYSIVQMGQYAIDPEGGTRTFSLPVGNTNGYSINSATGALTIGTVSQSLTLRVTDPGGLSDDHDCAVTIETASPSRKWNPGHYVQFYNATQATRWSAYNDTYINNNANLRGVMVGWKWRELEASQGSYSAGIALIQAELNKLRSFTLPKRLCIYVQDASYNQAASTTFPDYFINAGYTHAYGNGGCQWNRWDSAAMDRFIALAAAIGAAFDGEADVEMFRCFTESSLGGPEYIAAGETAYRVQLARMYDALQTSWPDTLCWVPFNWEPYSSMATAVNDAALHGMAVGSPDTIPKTNATTGWPIAGEVSDLQRSDASHYNVRDLTPVIAGVEDSELGLGAAGTRVNRPPYTGVSQGGQTAIGGYTAQEHFTYLNDVMRVSHIFWPRQNYCGTNYQRWFNYGTTTPGGILNVINTQSLTYTNRRTNW